MKTHWLMLTASAAILATIAFAPVSRWAFREHVEMLAGKWADEPRWRGYVPKEEAIARESETYEQELSAALHLEPMNGFARRLNPILSVAKKHPDEPEIWAHYLRFASSPASVGYSVAPAMTPKMTPKQVKELRAREEAMKPIRLGMVYAAGRGAAVDPDNAYFPLMKATALFSLDETEEGFRALAKAGNLMLYNDYALREAEVRIKALEQRRGYTGEYARFRVLASTLYPHFTHVNALARHARALGDDPRALRLRLAMAKVAHLIYRGTDSVIGLYVAISSFSVVTRVEPESREKRTKEERTKQFISNAAKFQKQLDAAGIEAGLDFDKTAREFIKARRFVPNYAVEVDYPREYFGKYAGMALSGLLSLAVFSLLFLAARALPAVTVPRAALPAFAAGAASAAYIPLIGPSTLYELWNIFCALAVAYVAFGVVTFIPSLRNLGAVGCMVTALCGALLVFAGPFLWFPPFAFWLLYLLVFLARRRVAKRLDFVPFSLITILCGTFLTAAAFPGLPAILKPAYLTFLPLAAAFALLSAAWWRGVSLKESAQGLIRFIPATFLLASACYAVFVGINLRENERYRAVNHYFTTEADSVRAAVRAG